MWALSVWHAQQAVELAVKSVMYRTCGITESELKGGDAHNLDKLFKRIFVDVVDWPVAQSSVQELSVAYIGSRYVKASSVCRPQFASSRSNCASACARL